MQNDLIAIVKHYRKGNQLMKNLAMNHGLTFEQVNEKIDDLV